MDFPILTNFRAIRPLVDLEADLIQEIQTLLTQAKFYAGGDAIGVAGQLTQQAFARFKASVWLDSPELLGPSTARALLEIAENHTVIEEQTTQAIPLAPEIVGTKAGRKLKLFNGEEVYQHQFIVPGIPLTWGEMTNRCDPERSPVDSGIIRNLLTTAQGFGKIRDKYGSAIAVTSGYRPPKVNQRIGGARFSQHIQGLAIDIYPCDGKIYRLLEVCRDSDCSGLGRGMHRGFIHVDWRTGERTEFNY